MLTLVQIHLTAPSLRSCLAKNYGVMRAFSSPSAQGCVKSAYFDGIGLKIGFQIKRFFSRQLLTSEELTVTCKPFRLLRAWFRAPLAGVRSASGVERVHREGHRGGTGWRRWNASVWLVLAVALAGWLPAYALGDAAVLQGLFDKADQKIDRYGLYWVLAVAVALALLSSLALPHIYRLNRKLHREVLERKVVEAKFRGLVEQSLVGIFIIQDGRFAYVNPKLADIFGYAVEDIVGRLEPMDLIAQADREQVKENIRRCLGGEISSIRYVFSAVCQDGRLIDVEVNGEVVDYEGRPAIVGMALDITERNRAQRQLSYLAFYDPLTDLPNRALFFDRFGQTLVQSKRDGFPFALLLLDLDGFKAVNDAYGHETGDALLQAVGRRLRNCVRESDTVARMGGDEFVILLPRLREPNDTMGVADKVIESLARPFSLTGYECRVGASIGLCIVPDDGGDMETLLSRADAAMYRSKERGKNTWTRYEPTLSNGKVVKAAFLEWSEEWSVGVPVIDEQHARLMALLRHIGDTIKTGQPEERIQILLDKLIAFTRYHFESEERLMSQYGYADTLVHQQAHRKLLEDLLSIQRRFPSTSLMLTLQALKEWLITHITERDRRLGEALIAAEAVKSASAQQYAA